MKKYKLKINFILLNYFKTALSLFFDDYSVLKSQNNQLLNVSNKSSQSSVRKKNYFISN